MGTVFQRWWPLAFSWLMMAIAVPMILAVIGRFPDEEIHLAAYGSFALPIGLVFEAPVLMLLAASTALCENRASHRRVWRFMMGASGVLSALHALVAFTPLADVVLRGIMDADPAVVEPARTGLMISLPWTWAIGYRRFHQGVLIRFGHSKAVGVGAVVRVGAVGGFLALGYAAWSRGGWDLSGTVVGTSAHALGVMAEAVFIGLWVRPVRREQFEEAEQAGEAPSWAAFARFYAPLALTSMISLANRPLYSTGMSMMPDDLPSLAVFPATIGLLWPLRSAGMAYKEVVVALLEESGSLPLLKKFTSYLTLGVTVLLLVIALTPLDALFFRSLSDLKPELAMMGELGLWFILPIPGLTVLMNWYQGQIVHGGDTVGITESVALNLATIAVILGGGVWLSTVTGYYVALVAMTLGYGLQTAWLWYRSRPVSPS